MDSLLPISTAVHADSEKQNASLEIQHQKDNVDAGALFVLKSKGNINDPFSFQYHASKWKCAIFYQHVSN